MVRIVGAGDKAAQKKLKKKVKKQEAKLAKKKAKAKAKKKALNKGLGADKPGVTGPLGGVSIEEMEHVNPLEGVDMSKFDADEQKMLKKFVDMRDADLLSLLPEKASKGNNSNPSVKMEREARLVMLHRYMLRGWTNVQISKALGVTAAQVPVMKKKLAGRIQNQIGRIDFGLYIGESFAFHREVRSMCMEMANDPKEKIASRAIALNTGLKAEQNLVQVLEKLGVFAAVSGDNPLTKGISNAAESGSEVEDMVTKLALQLKDDSYALGHDEDSSDIDGADDTPFEQLFHDAADVDELGGVDLKLDDKGEAFNGSGLSEGDLETDFDDYMQEESEDDDDLDDVIEGELVDDDE